MLPDDDEPISASEVRFEEAVSEVWKTQQRRFPVGFTFFLGFQEYLAVPDPG